MGQRGEYSDRLVWPVAVFSHERQAQDFVDELSAQTRARNLGILGSLDPAVAGDAYGFVHDPPDYWISQVLHRG